MSLYQILSLCGIGTIVGVIIELLVRRPLTKRLEAAEEAQTTQQKKQDATMLGVQALLRDRLLQGYRHYIAQGWCPYDERQNMQNMYTNYEALGPNSVMDQLHRQFEQLPEQPAVNKNTGDGGSGT